MDQIQAMRIFTRVVEAGTFTRAADSLSLPKATVTKHVQALEERLRVKLLNRTTRRVTVTADGAAYYERTVRLLSDLDDIEASMTNARANPMGRLRVDVGTSVAQLLIIPHLADFQTRFPDIQLDLGVSDRTVDLIGDNVDCVIRGGELSDQSLVARRIGNLEFITVASPDYLRAKARRSIRWSWKKSTPACCIFHPSLAATTRWSSAKVPVHRHQRPLPGERE